MLYTFFGDIMKVKVIDEGHEKDLEESINNFIKENNIDIIDIKFNSSCSIYEKSKYTVFLLL